MPELAHFQDAFLRALNDPGVAGAFAQRGMVVYRNTIARGLTEVLRSAFPTVERIVGDDWFAAAALAFVRRMPPGNPVLADYGAGFSDFLAAFPPAEDMPYLADVAAIDRLWTEAHFAPDAPPLDAAALAALAPENLVEARLRLHASARFAWFETPAPTLWRLNRPPAPPPGPEGFEVDWRAEGIALGRPEGEVRTVSLGAGGFAFLEACRDGAPLGEALLGALAAEPELAVEAALADLAAAGLFGRFDLPERPEEASE